MPVTIIQDYEDLEKIGEGRFGRVFKVRCRENNQVYARKEIHWGALEPHIRKLLQNEVRLLLMIKHPNVVGYKYAVDDVDKQTLHIFMEYCAFGDLKKYISNAAKEGRMILENQIWSILEQLTMALFRCHNGYNHPRDLAGRHGSVLYGDGFRFYHRDLKPENIFIDSTGSVKLGDFGLCGLLEPGECMRSTFIGTHPYMSPELLNGQPYSEKSETWGLGCILHELVTRGVTFSAESMELDGAHARVKIPGFYSEEIQKVIRACFTIDPEKRPGVRDLADHPCVVKARGERHLRREYKKWSEMKRIADREQEEAFSRRFDALNVKYQAAVAELRGCEGITRGQKVWEIRNSRLKVKARGLERREEGLDQREAALSSKEAASPVKRSGGRSYQLLGTDRSQSLLNGGVDKVVEKSVGVRSTDKGGGEQARSVEIVEEEEEGEETEVEEEGEETEVEEEAGEYGAGEKEEEEMETEEDYSGNENDGSRWGHKHTKSHVRRSYELD